MLVTMNVQDRIEIFLLDKKCMRFYGKLFNGLVLLHVSVIFSIFFNLNLGPQRIFNAYIVFDVTNRYARYCFCMCTDVHL